MDYKHTCDTIITDFQGITNNIYGFGRPFFGSFFCPSTHISTLHIRFYPSKWRVDGSLHKAMRSPSINVYKHRLSMYMSSIIFCRSPSINVYEQYNLLLVTVHQCIQAVLSSVGHRPSMYTSSIIFCWSPSINVYKQYNLLLVTVHQCIQAVLSSVGHRPSMYTSSIIFCWSPSINVYKQYYLLSVTVHQCIRAV